MIGSEGDFITQVKGW